MKWLAILLLSIPASLQAQSSGWSCSAAELPQECSGTTSDGTSEAREKSCLLRLYSCGRYEAVIHRISQAEYGLNKTQNYFLGVSYFGLMNRVRSQSLRCYYVRNSRQQIAEFLDAVQTVCTNPEDPSSCGRNPVSFGSDGDIDMIYHASKVADVLKNESGCSESAYTEASIYRFAKKYANDILRSSAHGVETGHNAVSQSIQKGFKDIQASMNLFVTEASKLESRYTRYSILMNQSEKDLNDVAVYLRDTALSPEIIGIDSSETLPKIQVNADKLSAYLDGYDTTLLNYGIIPIREAEKSLDHYFKKNTGYYNDIKNENLQRVDQYLIRSALFNNLFRLDGDVKDKIKLAAGTTSGTSKNLDFMSQTLKEYTTSFKNKHESCANIFYKNKWHCKQ